MTIRSKVLEIYRREGWSGIPRQGTIKLLSSVAWITDTWAKRLQQSGGVYNAEDKALLARNEVFRNRHLGKRCFVIGNGPSLGSQDLSPLANEITLVMSGFWKHPMVARWQPTYYFFADPLFFDGSEPMRKFFADLRSHIHSTTFFVPLSAKKVVEELALLPLEQTFFVFFQASLKDRLAGRPDFTTSVPGVQSVSQMAIMVAMYFGCSPIYLLGLDHDWLAQRGMDRHFYEGKTIEGHPVAHGDLDRFSYKSDLVAVLDLWNGYENIQSVAASRGVNIVNATCGGFLDVFPRVEYATLL
jgi:hypothetical protein